MLTEQDIKGLIEQKSETKNLDYKESVHWQTCKDEKLELTKDLLAMANTQDGGRLILGVKDKTYDFVGMPEDDWRSFDPTKVNEFAQKFAGPAFSCQIYKHVIEGKRVVCIDVSEFDRDPVICEADANSSSHPSKLILAKGALYIRTRKPSREPIRSAEDMRDFLARALLKKGDELLRSIEQLIKGKPQSITEESKARYGHEINDANTALFGTLGVAFGNRGSWQLIAHPVSYDPRRIPEIPAIGKLIQDSEVFLAGSTFPYTDAKNTVNFSEGRQSYNISLMQHTQAYRAYRSGLFVWRGVFWEDTLGDKTADGPRMLVFPVPIYDVTKFLLFCKRYYERLDPESVSIRVFLHGTQDRVLTASAGINLGSNPICHEPSILAEEIIKMAELRASYDEIARRFLKHIFALFNIDDVSDETLSGWQTKLLEGRI